MNRLLGKRVLITAAGQGMGRAAALAMAAEGFCNRHKCNWIGDLVSRK